MQLFRKSRPVSGYDLPGRRFTIWALYYFLVYFALPLMATALVLDGLLYAFFKYYYEVCFGVFCVFE